MVSLYRQHLVTANSGYLLRTWQTEFVSATIIVIAVFVTQCVN